jgi:hypothetical protein
MTFYSKVDTFFYIFADFDNMVENTLRSTSSGAGMTVTVYKKR